MATDDRAIFRNRGQRIGQGLRTATDFAGRVMQQSHDTGAATRQGIRDIVMAPINAAWQFGQGVRSGLGLPPSAATVRTDAPPVQNGASRTWGEPAANQTPAETSVPAVVQSPQAPNLRNAATAAPAGMSTSVIREGQPVQNYEFAPSQISTMESQVPAEYVNNQLVALNKERADLERLGAGDRGYVGASARAPELSAADRIARLQEDAAGIRRYAAGQALAQDRGYGVVSDLYTHNTVGPEGERYFNPADPTTRFSTPEEAMAGKAGLSFENNAQDAAISGVRAKTGLLNAQTRAIPEELAISRQGLGLRQAALNMQRNALPEQAAGNPADRFVDIYGTQLNPATNENEQTRRTAYIDASGNLQYVGGGGSGSEAIERLRAIGKSRGYSDKQIDKMITERIFGE